MARGYRVKLGELEHNLYPGQFAMRLSFGEGVRMSSSEIILELEEHKPLVTAIVVSGKVNKGIGPLLKLVKSQGFLIMLESYGDDPYLVGELCMQGLLDGLRLYVAGSLTNKAIQRKFLGDLGGMASCGFRDYRSSFVESLKNGKSGTHELEISFLVVPGLNDKPKYVRDASLLAKNFGARFVLQGFESDLVAGHRLEGYSRPSRDELLELAGYSLAETWIRTRESGYEFVKP